jgi:hypothetical protein
LNGSAHGVLFPGPVIRFMRAAALAAAAPGFFSGTAPHQRHRRTDYNDQEKELLPIHAANITAKSKRATVIFHHPLLNLAAPSAKYGKPRASHPHPGPAHEPERSTFNIQRSTLNLSKALRLAPAFDFGR